MIRKSDLVRFLRRSQGKIFILGDRGSSDTLPQPSSPQIEKFEQFAPLTRSRETFSAPKITRFSPSPPPQILRSFHIFGPKFWREIVFESKIIFERTKFSILLDFHFEAA